jgi:hypothetical protein
MVQQRLRGRGIFFGFLADRVGPRRLYSAVLAGCSLAGVASPLASWPAIAEVFGEYIKQTGSYNWPLITTGLAPLAGVVVLTGWVALASRGQREGEGPEMRGSQGS